MVHPALRSSALALCAWGIWLVLPHGPVSPRTALADDISIRFDQIEDHLQRESPRARIFAQELVKLQAARDDDTQWSNPELAYDHEEVEEFREYQVTLHKRLTAPWVYSRKRAGWSARIEAAEFRVVQETTDLLADLKSSYVRIQLLDAYLARLSQLESIVTDAHAVAEAQYSEGKLSGVEKHLIQLSALSVDTSRRTVLQHRRHAEGMWRADMGLGPNDRANLVTKIAFGAVTLDSPAEYVSRLHSRPQGRSLAALGEAFGKQAAAARPSLLPRVDLYAGFKHIDPEHTGLVAGAAVSLPLFGWGAAATRQHEAQQRIAENELALFMSRTTVEVETLVQTIEEVQPPLAALAERMGQDPPMIDNMLYSYREGAITLDTFLSGIRIEVDGLRDYYELLTSYYENLFRLEAITGAELVSFES